MMPYEFRGKYFEDLPVGAEFFTPARTINEADVVAFASFSGDFNPLHTDKEYCAKGPFGERIAHGMVSLAVYTGLLDKIGLVEGTAQAFLGLEWKFTRAVKFGDTISCRIKVAEARKTSRPGSGIVKLGVTIVNQKNEEVSGGIMTMMMATRNAK